MSVNKNLGQHYIYNLFFSDCFRRALARIENTYSGSKYTPQNNFQMVSRRDDQAKSSMNLAHTVMFSLLSLEK